MKVLIQVVGFCVMVLGGYAGFSNWIPQMQAMPPVDEEISLEGMTMESYVAWGERIFNGKGTCTLCHKEIGGRAPVLHKESGDGPPVGIRAAERIKDPRYKGKATNGEEYLRESEEEPSAFVVVGFGKPGTNDTVSPMPPTNKGAIGLSPVEMNAIIAYFQSTAGVDITVPLPTGDVEVAEEEPEEATAVKTMVELANKYECNVCHQVPGIGMEEGEADIGPPLADLKRYAKGAPGGMSLKEYIRQSIMDPNAFIADTENFEPDTMPADFQDRLRISELELAINYLYGQATGTVPPEVPEGAAAPAEAADKVEGS